MTPLIRSLALAAVLCCVACDGSPAVVASIDASNAPSEPADDAGEEPGAEPMDSGPEEHDGEDAARDIAEAGVTSGDSEADGAVHMAHDAGESELDANASDGGATLDSALDAATPGHDGGTLDASGSEAGASGSEAGASEAGASEAGASEAGTSEAGADASVGDAAITSDPTDWTCFGKDLANTRYNAAETRINKSSVSNLRESWRRSAPGISATPAIAGEVAYWADWQGTVQATRLGDGSLVWSQRFPFGFTSSPCVTSDLVFVADRRNTLYALERASGATRWATVVNSVALTHLWSSPIVADGVVLIGISADGTNADRTPLPPEVINTFRGAVVGVSAQSGAVLWRFETTRVAGQPADAYAPGVSVWSSAAVDLARGLMYIGTGNSYALPASPYSDALLALRYRTGELAWSVQFTPNDGYSGANPSAGPDYDIGAAPNLFTIDTASGPRDVVGVGDKGGRYRVFDRGTGTLIWERQLEPGFNLSGRKTGGIIAPAAVARGRVYVASNTSWHDSRVWALDANSGSIVWSSATLDSVNFGGPALVDGVLFFGGSGFRFDEDLPDSIGVGSPGELIAFDADDGSVLHRTRLFAGRGAGFAVAHGRLLVGTGFTFYGYSDEPVDGALQEFTVP